MNIWELVLWASAEFGGKCIIIIPDDKNSNPTEQIKSISDNFNLNPDHHLWLTISTQQSSRTTKSWWDSRDNLAFDLAHNIVPISIRPDGKWDHKLAKNIGHRSIDERFRVKYVSKPGVKLKIEIPKSCFTFDKWDYLTHWTRRCYGPWPGERASDYYRELVANTNGYNHSALHTLHRILDERLIRASGDHIRNNKSVVAFTSLQPSDALHLMRWRSRYVRPTFEPYGIAIHKRSAVRIGIRPVTYAQSGSNPPDISPELVQGYGIGDWPRESEWRAQGDIHLDDIPSEDLIILIPTSSHVAEFSSISKFLVIALDNPSPLI
jgi:hypothetical protein